MEQIDAATAVEILVAAASPNTVEPALKAMERIESAARRGDINVRGRRGSDPERQTITAEAICDLDVDWMAFASEASDTGGEANLVPPGWGNPFPRTRFPEGLGEPNWWSLRFIRNEIEGLAGTKSTLTGSAGRKPGKAERIAALIASDPTLVDLPYKELKAFLREHHRITSVDDKTIRVARKKAVQRLRGE